MDIKEIREAIRQASNDIRSIVESLQIVTDININNISMDKSITMSGKTYIIDIHLDASI